MLDAAATSGLELAQVVAAVADAFVEASRDRATLEATIVERIGTALEARCVLTTDPVAASMRRLVLPLRRVDRLLMIERDGGAPAFDRGDIELAGLLASHAAIAIHHVDKLHSAEATRSDTHERLARFARLGESGMLGVVFGSVDALCAIEVNESLATLLGYSRDELLAPGFNWQALTAPEFRDLDTRAIAELRASRMAPLREKQFIRKDGSRVWVMVGSTMFDDRVAISFILDIDERKREALAQRRQLAAIVDSSADAIVGKTLDGVITSWNAGATELFGYTAVEAVGMPITMLIPPGREPEEVEVIDHLRRGEVTRFDTVRRHKDGRDIDVAVTSSPIFDSSGHVIGGSKVARDITERRAAESSLASAKEAAEAASRELEAFSYSVAHDLRAPLRGIDAFARFLLDDYADKLDAEGRDHLDEIRSNAKKMSELIDALLSLSRVTRSELRREMTDLASIVRGVTKELASTEPGRSVEVIIGEPLRASVDPRLAKAMIANLVGNAWKFTSQRAQARIEVGTARDPALFFVRDNGAGFDMAHAAKLFAPFQRMHTVREFPGTGIGLATVQRIVHRHGGRIWAEAAVGKGATFYFTFPEHAEAGS